MFGRQSGISGESNSSVHLGRGLLFPMLSETVLISTNDERRMALHHIVSYRIASRQIVPRRSASRRATSSGIDSFAFRCRVRCNYSALGCGFLDTLEEFAKVRVGDASNQFVSLVEADNCDGVRGDVVFFLLLFFSLSGPLTPEQAKTLTVFSSTHS